MFKGVSALFVGTLLAIPIIGQIEPTKAMSTLATGTTQMVLALVAVVEFGVLAYIFRGWRKDVADDKILAKETADKLASLLVDNSVAINENANASHRVAKAMDGFEKTVGGFDHSLTRMTDVISKCERSQ